MSFDSGDLHPPTRPRRLAIIAMIAISLGAVVMVHSPSLPYQAQALGHGITNSIGQEMRWAMFSPDPRNVAVELVVEIEYPDGTMSTWRMYEIRQGLDVMYYRRIKWMEQVVMNPRPGSAAAFAKWLATELPSVPARMTVYTERRPRNVADQCNCQTVVEVAAVTDFADG